VVVAEFEAGRSALSEAAEAGADTLPDIGSRASKRVARRAAWMPTHSAEQWSTATKIEA
jgi:hypothetical protein